MNCQEFDEIWNRLLDHETLAEYKRFAGLEVPPRELVELEEAALRHARECPRCCQAQASHQRLREALRAWSLGDRRTQAPPPQLVDCIRSEPEFGSRRPYGRWKARPAVAAAKVAAATLIAVLLTKAPGRLPHPQRDGDNSGRGAPLDLAAGTRSAPRAADARLLGKAVWDVTTATWDLAQTTSRPAAGLGRDVLEVAAGGHDPSALPASGFLAVSAGPQPAFAASIFEAAPGSPPASDLLRQVASEVSSSFRPLSSSARQALQFLRVPSLGKPESTRLGPASEGA